jgi:hypothetical protein
VGKERLLLMGKNEPGKGERKQASKHINCSNVLRNRKSVSIGTDRPSPSAPLHVYLARKRFSMDISPFLLIKIILINKKIGGLEIQSPEIHGIGVDR